MSIIRIISFIATAVLFFISSSIANSSDDQFKKDGNNGTVSCSTYCGKVKADGTPEWGAKTGACVEAKNESTAKTVSCDTVPGLIQDGKQLTCFCAPDMSSAIGIPDITKEEIDKTVSWWAPVIKFHSQEEFYPSSVKFALDHFYQVKMSKYDDGKPPSQQFQLNEPTRLISMEQEGAEQPTDDPIIRGQKDLIIKKGVPIYAFWIKKKTYVDIAYFVFYPYNLGKKINIGVTNIRLGNHVGDWEHITIRMIPDHPGFQGKRMNPNPSGLVPSQIYFSSHADGTLKNWNDVLKSDEQNVIAYAADGSHGFWPSSGKHTYNSTPELSDYTDDGGLAWETKHFVESFSFTIATPDAPLPWWLTDIKRWGNGRRGTAIAGQSPREEGPTGPLDKVKTFDLCG
ncbi:MAG: DUF946 domain-containing protein [Candidatus Electrothrix sp. AX5]|nr:DUF946 domain-containing protein [Candidatus Electrothrix sp. AX5]